MTIATDPKKLWEDSFDEQIARGAYNAAPVEALVRNVAYYLRARHDKGSMHKLQALELGCGAGPNLVWLAQKGLRVNGIDIASNALRLARENLENAGYADLVGDLIEGSVDKTPFADASFDVVIESCVFQHIERPVRMAAFAEVRRVLKQGGLFVGNMLSTGHTTFQQKQAEQLKDDPGSLYLADGVSKIYLTNIGLSHFFSREEFGDLLTGFSTVDPLISTYYLPQEEAKRRGYDEYLQSMWTVYAIK
ncbi:MAG: class I SAM-dependent methyltransferase [Nitrospira sp. CG24E]|nr:MAG: class I SAM-dependent methyltransferase [Nitrospira sp. CG24E]